MNLRRKACALVTALLLSLLLVAQESYRPKFPGDPARSESEAAALGSSRECLQNGLVVGVHSRYQDSQIGPRGLQSRH